VRIEVHDVKTHVAGTAHAEHGVGVGAVVVEQAARLVHQAGDLVDVLVEHTQSVGVGEHEAGEIAVQVFAQRRQVTPPRASLATGTGS